MLCLHEISEIFQVFNPDITMGVNELKGIGVVVIFIGIIQLGLIDSFGDEIYMDCRV